MSIRRSLIISLWAAFLYLPFKGPLASALLFAALFAVLLLVKSLSASIKDIIKTLGPLWSRSIGFSRGLRIYVPAAMFAFAASLPFYSSSYVIDVSILAGIYIILALGLNVVVGYTGLLNLGFVAFYAVGAYSYALLNTRLGIGFWLSIPMSVGLSALAGFLLAVPALRLRGDYLAIVTLGFGEITRLVLNNWDSLTNGPNGISGIAPPFIMGISFGGLKRYYYIVLLFAVVSILIIKRVSTSRLGRAWIAIKEDETASASMGINTNMYKLYSVSFGAFWAGLAGTLFAAKMQFVSPESFTFMESVLILCMVILGGMGSIPGVILGALVLVVLPEVLRELQLYRMLALGAGLVLLMIFRPQGILGGRGVFTGD